MRLSRRRFLGASVAVGLVQSEAVRARNLEKVRIGVTDWNLKLSGKLEALSLAKEIGLAGVEVSLGRAPQDGKLPLDNLGIQEQYRAESRRLGVALAGTCLNILHRNYLKSDQLGQKWLADGIQITAKLGAGVMLLPFFGKGALETQQEIDYVGDVLREHAPAAAKAGVILGLENTNSARENARIMERSRSEAVKVYYDVGNSTQAGYDIFEEMPWLGAERICQLHLKDNPHYLGEGSIDFPRVMRTVAGLGYAGFANLETQSPSGSVATDMRRNLDYIRRVMEEVERS